MESSVVVLPALSTLLPSTGQIFAEMAQAAFGDDVDWLVAETSTAQNNGDHMPPRPMSPNSPENERPPMDSAITTTTFEGEDFAGGTIFPGNDHIFQHHHQTIGSRPNHLNGPQFTSRGGSHNSVEKGDLGCGNNVAQEASNQLYPLGHPLGVPKHVCAICGDRASGKHYGVYSCEGCKGFFKRTVRKDLAYSCREAGQCVIDKRQRNRCQFCRYQKCLSMGMKREAVQEERQRLRSDRSESNFAEQQPESTSSSFLPDMMAPEKILEAELLTESNRENIKLEPLEGIESGERQLMELVAWAKMIPHFSELPLDDQALLLQTGWTELILANMAYRSCHGSHLILPSGQRITKLHADTAGISALFDSIMLTLGEKLRELRVDKTEFGCLKVIILFKEEIPGIQTASLVESYLEKVYCCLEEYCRVNHPSQPGRFAQLLLRFPALRSVAIKCIDAFGFIPAVPNSSVLKNALSANASPLPQAHAFYHGVFN